MTDFEQLRSQLFLTNPDAATAEAFDCAIKSRSILRDDVCPVLDANRNPLVVDNIYVYQKHRYGKQALVKIKIRRWSFGSGNILNRYYRVFYTDEQLEDSFLVVDAQYLHGVCGGAVYLSQLVPFVPEPGGEAQ